MRPFLRSGVYGVGICAVSLLSDGAVVFSQSTLPLYNWYSPSRGDNFATTDPRWRGMPGQTRSPDYRLIRIEGTLFNPALSQPSGTDSVYSWYHPGRGDNFLTSDPRWAGKPGDTREGYRFVRLEGFIHELPRAGTLPLQSFWNSARADNFATSDPRWIGSTGDRREPNYRLYRTEGFLGPAPSPQPPDLTSLVGYGRKPVRGVRPLLVVLTGFTDISVTRSEGYFDTLIFGPGYPNIRDYFSAASGGQFTWRKAGLLRVQFRSPIATAGANAGEFDKNVTRLAAAAGFDFTRYDTNGDDTVSYRELGLLVINPVEGGGGAGGQTRARSVTVNGKVIDGNVSYTHENGDITLYAHELFHQLGFPDHIYGPSLALNFRASLFAANGTDARPAGPMQLDPWHRLLTGWLPPRVYPITRAAHTVVIDAAEPLSSSSRTPVVLYDPARGFDEMFILEYRTPTGPYTRAGGYDAKVLGQGIAAWYVRLVNDTSLYPFNWPPPFSSPYRSPGPHMYANYLLGKDGPGKGPFWTSEDGEFQLVWGDSSDSKVRVRVGPLSSVSGMATVQWRHADLPFAPRVDRVTPDVVTGNTAGWRVTLDGEFPVDTAGVQIQLTSLGVREALLIVSMSGTRLIAASKRAVPPGDYLLTVRTSASPQSVSNGMRLRIRAR